MGLKNQKLISIKHWIIVYQLILIFVVAFIMSIAWTLSEYIDFKNNNKQQMDLLLKSNKAQLVYEVEKTINLINFIRKTSDNDSIAKERVLDFIADYRLFYAGYIFVNQTDGKALVFDGNRVNNKSILKMTDSRGDNLFQMELDCYNSTDGGFMEYYFKKLNDSIEHRKIAFVHGYKEFGWMIGAGNYIGELETENSDFFVFFKESFLNRIGQIILLLFSIFAIIYFISRKLSVGLNRTFVDISNYIDNRLTGKPTLEISNIRFYLKEIKDFFFRFNNVIDKKLEVEEELSKYMHQLEQLVEERTLKLQMQTEELKLKNGELEESQTSMLALLEDLQLMQKDLKLANHKLNELNQDLQSFNYTASHDLKAPLRVINNYAKFLEEEISSQLNSEQQHMLSEIIDQSSKLSNLLVDLLRFSQTGIKSLKIDVIDMKELFIAIVSESLTAEQKNRFDIQIKDLPPAKGDYSLIKQVVINLVSNAIKFTNHLENPKIIIDFENQKDKILYFVKDNGIGFNSELSDEMFNLFGRLKNSANHQGTGVGLAIVKRIINKHGGQVFSHGEIGKGAELGFTLID